MSKRSKALQPRSAATADMRVPEGTHERFAGYGVMGLPFRSGHYLTFRHFPASSVGPGYKAVWHRSPSGEWEIYTDAPGEYSCPRYFSAATARRARMTTIEAHWPDSGSLRVVIADWLDWTVSIGHTPATRMMSAAAALLPEAAWASDRVLSGMGYAAGPLLKAGRIRLRGRVPNRQWFQFAPRIVWSVLESSATVHGQDIGEPGPLDHQDRLGDFWMPQCGLFALGTARFETYDIRRHVTPAKSIGVSAPVREQ